MINNNFLKQKINILFYENTKEFIDVQYTVYTVFVCVFVLQRNGIHICRFQSMNIFYIECLSLRYILV